MTTKPPHSPTPPYALNITPPYALNITAPPDIAFDLADRFGMANDENADIESKTDFLGVSIFDAPNGAMQVQALYASKQAAQSAQAGLELASTLTQLPEMDWVSHTQKSLPPVTAGRFVIHGSHDAEAVSKVAVPICIDAGLAFGTGHHGTTAGCLRLFSELLDQNIYPKSVLDLGCGAGVLAIAAAKTLPDDTKIIATDIDMDAVIVTKENAVQNGVEGRIVSMQADGFSRHVSSPNTSHKSTLRDQDFELIFANILAGPLMQLAPDIVQAMRLDGRVILSGILDEKAAQVAAVFQEAGLTIKVQPSLEGWTSLLGIKSKSA